VAGQAEDDPTRNNSGKVGRWPAAFVPR
jgi:hypothetical protein